MIRLVVMALGVAALATAGVLWLLTGVQTLVADDLPPHQPDAERGSYIFFASGCGGCHATPEQNDPLRLGGGRELETDFGTFRVPNISPHPQAGIGGWSALEFANAMLRGVSPEGWHYYPSFPYTTYQRMASSDILDLKAFLDTVPPVATAVGGHEVPFPFNIRRGIGLWKRLYLDGAAFAVDPAHNETEARGAYLVQAMAHCGECHTPRDWLGGLNTGRWLAGAPNPAGEGRIPNITPHADGIANWSERDIAFALETGFTPDFDTLGSSMARVVRNTSQLTDEDRAAIAAYLKTVPPLPSSP
jgi:mono/diheme cytochrome c family protein